MLRVYDSFIHFYTLDKLLLNPVFGVELGLDLFFLTFLLVIGMIPFKKAAISWNYANIFISALSTIYIKLSGFDMEPLRALFLRHGAS